MIKYILALCLLTSSAFAVGPISGGSSVRPNAKVVDAAGGGDYTTIAAAITAGATNISVKSGTNAGGFTIPANTYLKGEPGVVVQAPISTTSGTNGIIIGGADVTIEDIELDGQYASQTNLGGSSSSTQNGVYLLPAAVPHRATMRRVYIHDVCNAGVMNYIAATDMTLENCRISGRGVAAALVLAAPAPTTTVFYVSPGTARNFAAGQSLRIGTQTGTVSSVASKYANVVSAASATVFTVNPSYGALFANGDVIRVGQYQGTISTISTDTITLTAPLAATPIAGQIVALDKITLTGAITAPTAGNLVAVTGTNLYGVFVQGVARPTVRNCYFTGWAQAIGYWYGVTDGTISGNQLVNNYGYQDIPHTINRSVIEVYPTTAPAGSNRIIGNLIDGSTHDCIEVAQGETGSIITNNILRNWASEVGLGVDTGVGVELTGQSGQLTTDNSVTGNHFFSNGAYASSGVIVTGFTARNKIHNNTFSGFSAGTSSYPVSLAGGDGQSVQGNIFGYCSRGIFVNSASSVGGVIEGNQFQNIPVGGSGAAIDFSASGDGWTISGNSIDGTTTATTPGILIQATGGNKHRIVNNRARGAGYGISVATNDNLISHNFLDKDVNDGNGALQITGAAMRNRVTDNIIINGATNYATVSIASTADYNQIIGNNMPSTDDSFYGIASIRITSSGTHNVIEPNSSHGVMRSTSLKSLGAQTVGTSPVTIAHGLGYTPTVVNVMMTSAGNIYRSATSDATNIYLTADASSRTADVYVR